MSDKSGGEQEGVIGYKRVVWKEEEKRKLFLYKINNKK